MRLVYARSGDVVHQGDGATDYLQDMEGVVVRWDDRLVYVKQPGQTDDQAIGVEPAMVEMEFRDEECALRRVLGGIAG